MEVEKLPEYYYFFFIPNNLSLTHQLMRTKSSIKFYILFVYLIIAKLLLACGERLTSVLVTVNYSKEIMYVSTTDFLRFI